MSQVKSILENLGYRLKDIGGGRYQSRANFRNGNNETALLINANGSGFHDFPHPENSGSFKKLIALTLGKPISKVDEYLKSKKYEELDVTKDEVDLSNTYASVFDIDQFGKILPIHDYWLKRGVPENIIKHFRGGVINGRTRLYGRYVLPIFARDGCTVNGFAARKLNNEMKGPKWACFGRKREWEYPLFLTQKYIEKEKEIIVVESFGDCAALCKMGVKNQIVPIGISSFQKLSLLCIEFDPQKIIIAFNNDQKSNAGNKAANNLEKCLLNFFNKDKIKVRLPQETNDLGDCDDDQLKRYIEYAKN